MRTYASLFGLMKIKWRIFCQLLIIRESLYLLFALMKILRMVCQWPLQILYCITSTLHEYSIIDLYLHIVSCSIIRTNLGYYGSGVCSSRLCGSGACSSRSNLDICGSGACFWVKYEHLWVSVRCLPSLIFLLFFKAQIRKWGRGNEVCISATWHC